MTRELNDDEGARTGSDSDTFDLHALDPDLDPRAEARFVTAVMARVAHRGAVPVVPTDPLFGLWSLPRPMLLAASVLALAVLGAAVGARRARDATPATIADATGVPLIFFATGAPRK